jgi:hypothetical protein
MVARKKNISEIEKLLAQLELDFPDAELIAEKEWFSRLLTSADSKVKEGRPWDAIHPLKNLLLKEPSYFANSHPDLGEISAKLAELETMFSKLGAGRDCLQIAKSRSRTNKYTKIYCYNQIY